MAIAAKPMEALLKPLVCVVQLLPPSTLFKIVAIVKKAAVVC